MQPPKPYPTFPLTTVLLSNTVSISIYLSGFLITLRLGWIAAVFYLVFILAFEYRLLSTHCINCFYYGKTCGFGKGRLSSLFYKPGDPSKFCSKQATWKDMLPDLLISLAPLLIAIVLMIIKFDLLLLFAALIILGSTTLGNGYIRGTLTCKYCKQRELGCPAEKLFNK
jgi:hypothetical protein